MPLRNKLNALLQKILFLWVRVDVLPRRKPGGSIQYCMCSWHADCPTCSLLQRITHRLELPDPFPALPIHGLKHHSIYSVASKNPVSD